ncbi:putative cAMP-dependent protein kinase pathway protein (Som1) [Aspergillus clavatus NRRL 1]|uniref:cAMP-dependent protein kinase pathway protein (Som1), putative n=1 Tax=Aspergillus clavatus (strain ATCC 1007 / CBS 513.65 / DSM 816 / NCTC 3887 / NRRL 1 / QM 1276 / 107) TaxID=344612 RepID=A1CG13_ASPCL|nr:cAMP-dependent protein kinase pathway protein (Som1), putative [Aspergillus clavatus NRRL 1]EAW10893.1 cAMP-dependent protein kinase pathway protein (Som1), putative [Aspergillus clavatus NRRL 1]
MNQMNVTGMNPGAGGPVGGVPMMNNGSTAPRNDGNVNNIPETMINNLNTYIYDYFLKRGYHECARALVKDESIKLNTEPPTKTSPGHRRDDVNGVEGDAMMTDSKDGDKIKIPDDLPRPNLASESQQSSFLLDWFSLFWDFFWAQRKKGNSNDVRQYLQHTQNMMRLREQQHNQLLRQQPVMPGQMGPLNMRRNGMVPANLQKTVLQNNTGGLSQQQLAQFQKTQQMQMMQQMQREHSDMDMNGHRPQSPSSAENAPSPSKRPRLENGPMNGQQLAPNGRGQGQGMPGQPNPQALLMQNGLNPRAINPAQFPGFQQPGPAAQQKSIQVYAQNLALHHSRSALNNQGIPNGLMNPGVMPNQTDLVPMPDGQGMYPMNGDYYGANGPMAQVRAGMQTPGGQHGNHALQDYQMQLMLLEQQNKRRLMMARQEQDSMSRADGQPPMPGQQGLPPGTSPQGSRAGTSPNPNDQMKRGTPKMPQTGLPGSPSAGDPMVQNRGSPAAMNFNAGQMPPEMAGGQFFNAMAGPNGMRPPSSNPAFTGPQMGQPIPTGAANRVAAASWQQQGQPMAPQQSPAQQPQPTGTPQQNSMPPPSAPPVGGPNAGRAAPQSPQNPAATPTPQPSKAAPKKKEPKEPARKRATKKTPAAAAAAANTAATPSSEAEHPPTTPTPPTPTITQHPSSFNKAGPNVTTTAPQPTSAPAPQPIVQQPPPDQTQQSFNDLSIPDASAFNLDFSALENPDILENFDFDTFLNTDADTAGFGFDPNISYPTDGVETGAGDGL